MAGQAYNPNIQKILGAKGGTAFPGVVNITDGDTGELMYSNKDIAWFAKSIFQAHVVPQIIIAKCPICGADRQATPEQIFKTGCKCFANYEHEIIPLGEPKDEEEMRSMLIKAGYEFQELKDTYTRGEIFKETEVKEPKSRPFYIHMKSNSTSGT